MALNTDNTPLSSIGSIQLNDESTISNSNCSISFLSTGIEINDNAIALIKRDRENEKIDFSTSLGRYLSVLEPGGGSASLVINPDEDYLSLKEFIVSGQALTNLLYCDLENNKIGIGTGSPTEKLSISEGSLGVGYTSQNAGVSFYSGNELSSAQNQWFLANAAGDSNKLKIFRYINGVYQGVSLTILNNNGYIGLNTTTPTSGLDVNGDIETTGIIYQGDPTTDGSTRLRADGAGNVYHEVRVSGSWVLA